MADKLPAAEAAQLTMTHTATAQPGLLVGTLGYMAPEQLRGEAATFRSDVWSLGVLLYEMASGQLPFKARSGTEVAANILKDTAPALPARVSASLRSIIERCLSKEPERRYSNGEAVHSALEAIASTARAHRCRTRRQHCLVPPSGAGLWRSLPPCWWPPSARPGLTGVEGRVIQREPRPRYRGL